MLHIGSLLAISGRGPSSAWPASPTCRWKASWSVAPGWSPWASCLHPTPCCTGTCTSWRTKFGAWPTDGAGGGGPAGGWWWALGVKGRAPIRAVGASPGTSVATFYAFGGGLYVSSCVLRTDPSYSIESCGWFCFQFILTLSSVWFNHFVDMYSDLCFPSTTVMTFLPQANRLSTFLKIYF